MLKSRAALAPPAPCGRAQLRVQATTTTVARAESAPAEDAGDARPLHDGSFVAVVADGIGSARHGRDAALKTVATFLGNLRSRPRAWSVPKSLDEITRHLNRQLYQEGLAKYEAPEFATTVAVAVLTGDRVFTLNAGDSRICLLRDGNAGFEPLSIDHREDADSHILTAALGLADTLAPATAAATLKPGDTLLLCSDGLSDVLSEAELIVHLRDGAAAGALVAAARGRATAETLDDITAVVLRVEAIGAADEGKATDPLPVPETMKAGMVIDGFTLRRNFRANDRIWLASLAGRSYVLKFAPQEARTNEQLLTNFVREIWHATTLKADFFPHAFVPENATARYYALEYLNAPTLRQWLDKHGPLRTEDAAALGCFVLRAEQFLLRHDFVHADLKPENLLVLKEGEEMSFRLIDLGSVAEVFSINTRAGTPSYLAPERFQGAAVSEATEIFSLGVTLYETVTGKLPFGEIEPFQTPVFRTPKPPSILNPLLPQWLDAVIVRAVAIKPEDRHRAYSELLFELEHPAQVRPFRSTHAPWVERHPGLFLKLSLAMSLLFNALLLTQCHR